MAGTRTKDLVTFAILTFDFVVAVRAMSYPLWTIHNRWFRASISVASWIGIISAVALPIWIVIRLFREERGHVLKAVELFGALFWIGVLGHQIIAEFPII
jgi:hypothetical protein